MAEGFGKDAGPKQGKVADVAVHFAAGVADAGFGFGQHQSDLAQSPALQVAHIVQRVAADEPRQQIGDVIDQRRIGDSDSGLKRVFSDAGEKLEVWQVEEDPRYPGFRRLVESRRHWPMPRVREALNMGISSVADWLEDSGENASSGAEAAKDMAIVESALATAQWGEDAGLVGVGHGH